MANIIVGGKNSLGSAIFDASAGTITFSGLGAVDLKDLHLITNMEDNIIVFNFAQAGRGGAILSNVLTLEFDTSSMSDTDELQIVFANGDPSMDFANSATRTETITPIWARYTDPETLVDAQDLTASLVDFGSEIDVRGYNRLGLYITADVNNSENVSLKLLGKTESGGIDEYDFEGNQVQLWNTSASDSQKYYEFDIGTMQYIQIQAFATTVGATAGDLTIVIDKKWRN